MPSRWPWPRRAPMRYPRSARQTRWRCRPLSILDTGPCNRGFAHDDGDSRSPSRLAANPRSNFSTRLFARSRRSASLQLPLLRHAFRCVAPLPKSGADRFHEDFPSRSLALRVQRLVLPRPTLDPAADLFSVDVEIKKH